MPIIPFQGRMPKVSQRAFIAPDAWVIGDVTVEEDVSIFFSAIVRGDIQPITIGAGTNIQEHCLLHTSGGLDPVLVGNNVTVGHRAILHGCSIGDNSLIGMGATILDNAAIGSGSIVGAHTLIPKGKIFSPGSLIVGIPGKVVREVTREEYDGFMETTLKYQETGRTYQEFFNKT